MVQLGEPVLAGHVERGAAKCALLSVRALTDNACDCALAGGVRAACGCARCGAVPCCAARVSARREFTTPIRHSPMRPPL